MVKEEATKPVSWKVEGMTCSNCARTISNYLEKHGARNVNVDFVGGEVMFDAPPTAAKSALQKGIESLGYKVNNGPKEPVPQAEPWNKFLRYVLFCAPFTLLLMLPMFMHTPWLHYPWVQFWLCVPVYVAGMSFFGRSAVRSIKNGVPNMNVLVAIGATAAFLYSSPALFSPAPAFFETCASIITLVFLGNYVEDAAIRSTQRSLNALVRSQPVMANMIAFDDNRQEIILPVESTRLHIGDLVLIKSGEQVPADSKILWGEATVNESILTGESEPLNRKPKDKLLGGSLLVDGTVRAQVTAGADGSTLANVINLVKRAQSEKTPVQQLADRISAVFIPVVIGIAALTFVVNYFILHDITASLMRSIAVLVISCPCAMGLATPAAIAVGLGRAARSGVLFRNAKSLELFRGIRQVVFDKTGTLTTGNFSIAGWQLQSEHVDETNFKRIVYSLEKYSGHPIAQCVAEEWKTLSDIRWRKIEEKKGLGMQGTTDTGDIYRAGSYMWAGGNGPDTSHSIYVTKNDLLLGWVDVEDEVRPEAKEVVSYLAAKGIKTILLSGDRRQKCEMLARSLGIDEVIAEQSPEQKLSVMDALTKLAPTVMVGDGINDAPALAKATIGISLSDASQVAMQTADVVLMNNGIRNVPLALGLGSYTFVTIRQNLFWAFFYNIIAIPVAAAGLLSPAIAALAMGLSDVVLAINSGKLFVKKVT